MKALDSGAGFDMPHAGCAFLPASIPDAGFGATLPSMLMPLMPLLDTQAKQSGSVY
jgi:hypothetical protein